MSVRQIISLLTRRHIIRLKYEKRRSCAKDIQKIAAHAMFQFESRTGRNFSQKRKLILVAQCTFSQKHTRSLNIANNTYELLSLLRTYYKKIYHYETSHLAKYYLKKYYLNKIDTHELEVERADTSRCHDSDSQTWPTFSRWQRCSRGGRRSFRSRAAETASTS